MTTSMQAAQALLERGHAAVAGRDLPAAEAAYLEAARLAPAAAAPRHGLGVCAQLGGDMDAAEQAYREALELEPGRAVTRAALGTVLLSKGQLADGFRLRDAWRELTPQAAAPVLPLPRWRGEALAGKRLLIWSEQGFGDQIMFARYAAALVDQGVRVTWVCPPELRRLFASRLGVETCGPEDIGPPELAEHDAYCPSSALPVPFEGAAFPQPYLSAEAAVPTVGLGIMTRGNPRHPNDANRSLPADVAAPMLELPGAVDLSPEATGARDFEDTASLVERLELVISVDTAIAHLAAALGKPVWILLPEPAVDWRWGGGGGQSRWYPSARLWRQTQAGDWTDVIAAVVEQARAR